MGGWATDRKASMNSQVNVLDLEVDTNCGDECLGERIVRVTQQQARLSHACAQRVVGDEHERAGIV